jgi:hypothetical protein
MEFGEGALSGMAEKRKDLNFGVDILRHESHFYPLPYEGGGGCIVKGNGMHKHNFA